MIRWARFALLGYAALIAVFAAFHLWVLIYLLVFGSFFATIIGNLTGSIQHLGLSHSVPDWRLVCHTVRVNPLIAYLYWNMNYHAEHHMYAAVPFWQLPAFHEAVRGSDAGACRGIRRGAAARGLDQAQAEGRPVVHLCAPLPGGRPTPEVEVSGPAEPLLPCYRPAAARSASALSVRSHVKSGSCRPKWPYAAVFA